MLTADSQTPYKRAGARQELVACRCVVDALPCCPFKAVLSVCSFCTLRFPLHDLLARTSWLISLAQMLRTAHGPEHIHPARNKPAKISPHPFHHSYKGSAILDRLAIWPFACFGSDPISLFLFFLDVLLCSRLRPDVHAKAAARLFCTRVDHWPTPFVSDATSCFSFSLPSS